MKISRQSQNLGGPKNEDRLSAAKKQETEQVVRNRMEEETSRKKQAEVWGAALLVSAHNMGIPVHSSSVPVSVVESTVTQKSLILPSDQYDSETEVVEKRPAPGSAQALPGPSVGVLPLHMIEEETPGEDCDHLEEKPNSPPCSGQQFSEEQYRMNTPAKAIQGTDRRGPSVKVPQGILTFVKRLKDPKLFKEILDKDAVEGRVLPIYTHVCIKC